jgi:hypothetical protein
MGARMEQAAQVKGRVMLKEMDIDGRPASVMFMTDDFVPVDPEMATMIKAHFLDEQGGVLFLTREPSEKLKAWRLARERARELLERKVDFIQDPETGRLMGSHPSGGDKESSGKGGGKVKVKKEDFDKAGIQFGKLTEGYTDEAKKDAEDRFVERWNESVGIEPAEFKKDFLGGIDATMKFGMGEGKSFSVYGQIPGTGKFKGLMVGNYSRAIDPKGKKAESVRLEIIKAARHTGIGKTILAGNIETYQKLGIEKVDVNAGLDVGGYAWAKYGYVPNQGSWDRLRGNLQVKIVPNASGRPGSVQAGKWSQLTEGTQERVHELWQTSTYGGFLDSENQNWYQSGEASEVAKQDLADKFKVDANMPEWTHDALQSAREAVEKEEEQSIPFTNKQLFDAINLAYERDEDLIDVSFDDSLLQEPEDASAAQETLPGIEPEDLSKRLTPAMREHLVSEVQNAFIKRAAVDAEDMDPPAYLGESVRELQEDYWSGMSESERLNYAIEFDLAYFQADEDEQLKLEPPEDPLIEILRSPDPKSIWKVADSLRGKELLLKTSWTGALDLKDKESMDRFNEYVGRRLHA